MDSLPIWLQRRICLWCKKDIQPDEPKAYDHYHYSCSREVIKNLKVKK